MKNKQSLSLLVIGVCAAVIAMMFMVCRDTFFAVKTVHHDSKNNAMLNIDPLSTNRSITNEIVNTFKEPEGFYKTITDQHTGQYAVVNPARNSVSLKTKDGNTIWTTNIAEAVKSVQIMGSKDIYSMQLFSNELVVNIGRAFVSIDKQTGQITRTRVR